MGRYARTLVAGLQAVPDTPSLCVAQRDVGAFGEMRSAPFTPWGRGQVGRRARAWSADIVHGLHVELPRSSVGRVVTVPDLIPLQYPASMPGRLRRRMYARLVCGGTGRADRVIVPSRLTADALVAFGVPAGKVVVIPLAVDEAFQPACPVERERARRRFAAGRRYVVAVAADRPHKNLDVLRRAAATLTHGDRVEVVVRGRPRRTPHQDGLLYVGALSDLDLRLLYVGAEALVAPSFLEGFGLPAVEAAACGVPVVCGPSLGALPLLGDAAVVVDVAEVTSVVAGVRRLLADDDERVGRGAAGRAAVEGLGAQAMARRTLSVYGDVLGGG
ncbi:MAG TPA: glycosyltransferase family 1 protein [Nitriliruptorales bacterium]|nr:glycosyltransferase family 1 protein [Nitriliruptorales bacterium]